LSARSPFLPPRRTGRGEIDTVAGFSYGWPIATFCLLHGKWHDPSCWEPLTGLLLERGHDVIAPRLPLDDPQTTFEDRARPAIEELAGVEGAVVVVGHSLASGYSPLVAVSSPGALLVHLCPAPVGPFADVGAPIKPYRAGFPFPRNDGRGVSVWDHEAAIEAMYSRLEPEDARVLADRLVPGSSPANDYPLAGHPDVPAALVYASHDEFFEPDWERWVAREILRVEPIELATGHFAMVEDPEVLGDALDGLAPG
jgi:hypothetical protein